MKHNYRFSAVALTLSASLFVTGCGESTSSSSGTDFNQQPVNETEFNEQALIANLVDNVIAPTFTEFQSHAELQQQAVQAYCEQEIALADFTTDEQSVLTAKVAAQDSWKSAMDTWQQAEMMQIGPLVENDNTLRNKIYSWPVVNTCAVDYDVMFFRGGTVNGAPYDITRRTSSRKGMAALEYLLFNENLQDSCDTAPPEGWRNLTVTEQKLARCRFAGEVAIDITRNADIIMTRWAEHAALLKAAGTEGSEFTTEHEAVNRLSDALFYLDAETKDGKLAKPLGLDINNCGSQACPEDVESTFAQHSLSNIINNLLGFSRLLSGEQGVGFTDYLNDVGDQETADSMAADVEAAISSAQSYEQSLADTLTSNPDRVSETHADVKKVTDKLKVDFINSLALELPKTSAGDND